MGSGSGSAARGAGCVRSRPPGSSSPSCRGSCRARGACSVRRGHGVPPMTTSSGSPRPKEPIVATLRLPAPPPRARPETPRTRSRRRASRASRRKTPERRRTSRTSPRISRARARRRARGPGRRCPGRGRGARASPRRSSWTPSSRGDATEGSGERPGRREARPRGANCACVRETTSSARAGVRRAERGGYWRGTNPLDDGEKPALSQETTTASAPSVIGLAKIGF